MLARLSQLLESSRPAERRVAAVVSQKPELVMRGTLLSVAREADVSEPTVLRFCRSLGFHSFNDLKIELARNGSGRPAETQELAQPKRIERDDTVASAADKVFSAAIDALVRVRRTLPREAIERSALAVVKARRVVIFGLGTSAIVAADAQHKLFRLAVAAAAYSDPHLQAMSAATLGPEDVVLAISQTGEPRDLIETTSVAVQGGATVIAVTRSGSPLASLAHVLMPIDIEEPVEIWNPMLSRLAHLAAIDALVVGVALLAPPSSSECLKRMQTALKARRIQRTPAAANRDKTPTSRRNAGRNR